MYKNVILLIFTHISFFLIMRHFYLFSHLNLNLYKYLPNLFNIMVSLKVVVTWCAFASLISSHLSFKTCFLRVLVSAEFIFIWTLVISPHTENYFFAARFLIYLRFQIPCWTHANQFLFIPITSDYIQFLHPILAFRRYV